MQSENTPMSDAPQTGISATTNPAIPAVPADIAALINNALQKQAAQFETIVNGLQNQLQTMNVNATASSTSQPTKEKPTPSARQPSLSTPVGRRGPRISNTTSTPSSAKSSKTPKSSIKKTAKAPTPPRKLLPLQIVSDATPAGFKTCRDALYVHIKMMWGLYKTTDIPPKPDAILLQDFYRRFSSTQEVEGVVEDPCSPELVALESIISMKELTAGGGKIARGLGHIDQASIFYMHGVLAKVGIRAWGPDLDDAADSLYNSACRITCLKTFRELLATGTYNYMNVDLQYINSFHYFIAVYNHYVHFLLAKRYKAEMASAGRGAEQNRRKVIQKNRERLCKTRRVFLAKHLGRYPVRYTKLCDNVLAHSDDEEDTVRKIYVIKTLPYRSKNATKFFRRLDIEILKEAQMAGKSSKRHIRRLPARPVPSVFTKVPKNLPIDFYDPAFFNKLQPGQKRLTADAEQVCFLPDAARSFLPVPHPDETLNDRKFTAKYLDSVLESYDLMDGSDDEPDEDFSDADDDDVDMDASANTNLQGGNTNDKDSDFYSEGEYGDLYDEDSEEEED